ncbi:MAG: peptidoglycan DD-metalloendopeptidase family protein [Cyanobacteriota bacterium]|nr:peptidoglycan DD-metalloendopeptidase family protein [Cyanobacteriota bacterium]
MKRTFTQKVKQVPSCAADSFDALLKLYVGKQPLGATIPTEVNRRARTSAAIIGLAISMSATGLLLPQQGDEAMAVEPVSTEPNSPSLAVEPSTSVSLAAAGEASGVPVATPTTAAKQEAEVDLEATPKPVIEHQVREGETLWDLSNSYQLQPEAIAASNDIQPSAVLPVGQKLKIPAVNGIVHEVKAGETIETLSESYGVEPTQLQAAAPMSEVSQLKAGESVTVPGNVDNLLKARQDVALNSLKEQRDRLNDSLAELRSEESTNLSEQATGAAKVASEAEPATPVTLPSAVLKAEESVTNAPKSLVGVPTSPVTLPIPTPQIASSPAIEPKAAKRSEASVVIPVPTPEIAASPDSTPKVATTPNLRIEPTTNPETAVKPQVPQPQPVLMQTLTPSTAAKVYQVKPGDTLDEIARRYNLSRSELIQANGLNNPNLLNVNQQLKIPQAQPATVAERSVTLLPGINAKSESLGSGLQQRPVAVPTPAIPTVSDQVTPVVPTQPQSQPKPVPGPVLAQTIAGNAQPTSRVAVDTQPTQPAASKSNPYIDRLRADILKLREEFQQDTDSIQAKAPTTVAVPTVTTPVPRSLNNASIPVKVNPEFNPSNRPNETLQAELQRRQPPTQHGPITIEVPPPLAAPRGLVATAPAPAESYNPAVRTRVGQTVSPELPPISAPDISQPGNPNQISGYIWPTKGVLTSGYGRRWGRMHKGIDIAAPVGTPVVAAAPGVVVTAGWNSGGYGNLVEIQHPDGSLTLYAHNNRILVRRGQEVAQGQQISEMGSTGFSTGPHCHFEVHAAGRGAVNPIALLPRGSK